MGLSVAAAALVVSAVGTTASVVQGQKARKQQRRAADITRKRNALESRRARLQTIEQFRQANGLVANQGAQTGAQGSSGFAALQSSLSSQLSSNLNFNAQLETFNRLQGEFLSKANVAQGLSSDFGAIASFANQFAVSKAKATPPGK